MVEKTLLDNLAEDTAAWRKDGYQCEEFPLIGEILAYQMEFQEDNRILQFLHDPQFLALERYWYVRLVLKTPHIINLYRYYYTDNKKDLFDALGVPMSKDVMKFAKTDDILEKNQNR